MSKPDASAAEANADEEAADEDATESYEDWVGREIDGRYRIDGLLGEGGMGAVFEAEHLKLMKKVAIKVIHPEFAGDGEVAQRFAREAMASAKLEHPHVASATDYGTLSEGGAYLVMQLVRGQSLRAELDEHGALGWARACEVGAQIADALSAAHKEGIVHRDLKPDNVMLQPRDDGSQLVKVLDFGIARVVDEKQSMSGQALTRVGTVIGTPGYMAPEQALGEHVDFKVDLYSLGLLLYEMTTGVRLFETNDLTAIVTRQLTEDPPRVSASTKVPVVFDELVDALLEREKDERPESASAVRNALRDLLLEAVGSGEYAIDTIGTTELAGTVQRDAVERRRQGDKADDSPKKGPDARGNPRRKRATAQTVTATPAPTPAPLTPPSTSLANAQRTIARGPLLPLLGIGCLAALFAGVVLLSIIAFGGEAPALAKIAKRGPDPGKLGRGVSSDVVTPLPTPPRTGRAHIPVALQQAFADLQIADSSRDRLSAARVIRRHRPEEEVPPLLDALARLETANLCATKAEQILRLQEIADPRAIPSLVRLRATDRNRCQRPGRRSPFGRRNRGCNDCLEEELDTAIASLSDRSAL